MKVSEKNSKCLKKSLKSHQKTRELLLKTYFANHKNVWSLGNKYYVWQSGRARSGYSQTFNVFYFCQSSRSPSQNLTWWFLHTLANRKTKKDKLQSFINMYLDAILVVKPLELVCSTIISWLFEVNLSVPLSWLSTWLRNNQ